MENVAMVGSKCFVTLEMLRDAAHIKLLEPGVFEIAGERWAVVGWDDHSKALACVKSGHALRSVSQ